MSFKQLPLEQFTQTFSGDTELSSVAIGGSIVSVSDEFFAEASNLLSVEPARNLRGQFGPNGALFDGWESRRHNPTYDWTIIRLGTSGTLSGFDIDTANFNGNEAPEASVQALFGSPDEQPGPDDHRWVEILPIVGLGPNSRHLFKIPQTDCVNFVKLNMYPDGGISRFRVYGKVVPVHPKSDETFDLAHVFAGGRVVYTSDQHFGVGANLIIPGRGKDMSDGWETKRSRAKGHKDWAVIKLGAPGHLVEVDIDTADFKGNFPESCEMHAFVSHGDINWSTQNDSDLPWELILTRKRLSAHQQHRFLLENVEGQIFDHVKITIYPDGGLKRVRVIGKKASDAHQSAVNAETEVVNDGSETSQLITPAAESTLVFPVFPLTPLAFAPFGQVVQAYKDQAAAPKGTQITSCNGGTASKFHKLALLQSSYPAESGATSGISIYRCDPFKAFNADGTVPIKVLERHVATNQVFIPMGSGDGQGLKNPGDRYLVVVANNGPDDRPVLDSLKAFVATTAQGIVYNPAVWHHPMTVFDRALDFACIETQIGDGGLMDCEIVEIDGQLGNIKLQLQL